MIFESAERIADAVLFEGYVLYPYRASAVKNRLRWQFGVLAPEAPCGNGEPSSSQTECLIEPTPGDARPELTIRVRCLRPRLTCIDTGGGPRSWLDGEPRSEDVEHIQLGHPAVARRVPLTGLGDAIELAIASWLEPPYIKVRLRLENHAPWRTSFSSDRDEMLRESIVGAHLLLAIEDGRFVSLLEPPEDAAAAVATCANRHTWPVLVGDRHERTMMLSSPIVLYDYPAVASQSGGDLFDGAEIDEILSLRILTLTDDEKCEARATDPRARAIVDRVESLNQEDFAALHGTMRSADFFNPPGTPSSDEETVGVTGGTVSKGSHVRLHPNRRADAMDMFLAGQTATVAGVYRDVDDRVYVAVTVDIDPGASMHASFGRFFYFDPSEVECI